MDTIYSLLKRAKELKEKSQVDSITPEEVGKLHEDTLAYIASLEQSTDGLGIKKVYQSKSAMEADTDPVGTNGKALRYGQLVSIYDDAHADSSENGNIYAYQKPGWLLMGKVSGNMGLAVVQETGNSKTSVMSQEAVTKSLREVKESVPQIVVKSSFGNSETDSISQAQVTALAKGVYISEENEVYKPIAPQASNATRWSIAGVAYNTNLTVLGRLVKAIQFIGSASDIEVGVVNIDTKEIRPVKTINSSDMTDGVPYELTLDKPLQLEERETKYIKGVVYCVLGQRDGLYVLPNNTGTNAYAYILMKCVEYKYGNFSEELKAFNKANLQATLGGLTASKDTYASQWAGKDIRVGANSIITELRYKAAENNKATRWRN